MGKGSRVRPHNKEQYNRNYEAVFRPKEPEPPVPSRAEYLAELNARTSNNGPYWRDAPRANGRMEWLCPHSRGHGNHIHGCDGCCERDDYPGRSKKG